MEASHIVPVIPAGKKGDALLRRRKPAAISSMARPVCIGCGNHIGIRSDGAQSCGACRLPVHLNQRELRQFARLVRKHWGSGRARDLIGSMDYRPALIVKAHARLSLDWSPAELAAYLAECAERSELADLYDRLMASRGDSRRACRI